MIIIIIIIIIGLAQKLSKASYNSDSNSIREYSVVVERYSNHHLGDILAECITRNNTVSADGQLSCFDRFLQYVECQLLHFWTDPLTELK